MSRRIYKYDGEEKTSDNVNWTTVLTVPVANLSQVGIFFRLVGSTLNTSWAAGMVEYLVTARRTDSSTPVWLMATQQIASVGGGLGYTQHFRFVGHTETGQYNVQLQVRAFDPSGTAQNTYYVAEAEVLLCDSNIA